MKKILFFLVVGCVIMQINSFAQGNQSNFSGIIAPARPMSSQISSHKSNQEPVQPHSCGARYNQTPSAEEILQYEEAHKKKRRKAPIDSYAYTQSIHNVIAKWISGSVYRYDFGTTRGGNDIYQGHALAPEANNTIGHSLKQLQRYAAEQGTVFNEGDDFYLNLWPVFRGRTPISFKLKFEWEDLGDPTNQVTMVIERRFGEGNGAGYADWQETKLRDFYDKVIPIIYDVYGPPSRSHEIIALHDRGAVGTNVYFNGTNQIHASWVQNREGDFDQPRLMVHEIIHGWRDNVGASSNDEWHYDPTLSGFEESFAEGVALIVMDIFVGKYPNYFDEDSGFNIHWNHAFGMPFEWDYDFQNHRQVTNADYWSTDVATGSHWIRYGMGATAIRKMYFEDNQFCIKFNAELYKRHNANHDLVYDRELFLSILETAKPTVERTPARTWANRQHIFDCETDVRKKVFMLTFTNLSWQAFSQDNRIHLYESHISGSDWLYGTEDQAGTLDLMSYFDVRANFSWYMQMNNIEGKMDIVNDWDNGLYHTRTINNNGHWQIDNRQGMTLMGPYQGPNPYWIGQTFTRDHEQNQCNVVPGCGKRPLAMGNQTLWTSTQDVANFWPRLKSEGGSILNERAVPSMNQSGLYRWNMEFDDPQGPPVKETYYRLMGDKFKDPGGEETDPFGLIGGIFNAAQEDIKGRLFIEHEKHNAEAQIDISNNSFASERDWTRKRVTKERQGNRSERSYTDPGKVHSIFIDDECDRKKIDFRTIGYGDGFYGVQMLLYNLDEFEDIIFEVTNSGPVCEGEDIVLSVSNNFPDIFYDEDRIKYTWKDPNGNIIASPEDTLAIIESILASQAGTYTLELEFFGCPIEIYTTEVIVNNGVKLKLDLITEIEACEGENVQLDVNEMPGATYTWTGPNNFSSSLRNPEIQNLTSTSTGIYQLNVVAPACGGGPDVSADTTVTVSLSSVLPIEVSILTNITEYCENTDISLEAIEIPDATYTWTGPNNYSSSNRIASVQSISTLLAGTYKVVAEKPGCGTGIQKDSAEIEITVLTNAVVIIDLLDSTEQCIGSDLLLTADSIPNVRYSWTGFESFQSNLISTTRTNLDLTHSGYYVLTGTTDLCNGEQSTLKDSTYLLIKEEPIFSINLEDSIQLCFNENLELSSDSTDNISYQWAGPDQFSASTVNTSRNSIQITQLGYYHLTGTIEKCDGTNLSISDSIYVHVSEEISPDVNILEDSLFLCETETLNLTSDSIPTVSYQWSGPEQFLSSQLQTSLENVLPVHSGYYHLQGTYALCNGDLESKSDSLYVHVKEEITLEITLEDSIILCENETLILTADSANNVSYQWIASDQSSVSAIDLEITNISIDLEGYFKLIASATSCVGSTISIEDSLYVKINPEPIFTVSVPDTIELCEGANLQLTVDEIEGVDYSWTGPNNFSSTLREPLLNNPTIEDLSYFHVDVSMPGCALEKVIVSDRILVTVKSEIVLDISTLDSIEICEQKSINISTDLVSGASYEWTGPNQFQVLDREVSIQNATTDLEGYYYITASITGCQNQILTDKDSTYIKVNAQPLLVINAIDSIISCEGDEILLEIDSIPSATYNWTGPQSFSSSLRSNLLTLSDTLMTGWYSITAKLDGCGTTILTSKDSIYLTVKPQQEINLSTSGDLTICEGQTAEFSVQEELNVSYEWTGPNNFSSNLSTVSIFTIGSDLAGEYFLTATATTCQGDPIQETDTLKIEVTDNIELILSNPDTLKLCEGEAFQLTIENYNNAQYNWIGPDDFASQEREIDLFATVSGNYQVVVEISACDGSPIKDSSFIFIELKTTSPASVEIIGEMKYCSGDSLELVANGEGIISWILPNASEITGSILQIPSLTSDQSGNYYARIQKQGCLGNEIIEAIDSIEITISETTAIDLTFSSDQYYVCDGDSVSVQPETEMDIEYSWIGPNQFSSNDSILTLENISLQQIGTYSLTITSESDCRLPSIDSVHVLYLEEDSIQLPQLDSIQICSGESILLDIDPIAEANYLWTGPNQFSSTEISPIILGTDSSFSGEYIVSVEIPSCNASTPVIGTASVWVTVNSSSSIQLPIMDSIVVCEGVDTLISVPLLPNVAYTWNGPNDWSSKSNELIFNPVFSSDEGYYQLSAIENGNCSIEFIDSIYLKVQTLEAFNLTLPEEVNLCEEDEFELYANELETATLIWITPNLDTLQNKTFFTIPSVHISDTGTYQLQATLSLCNHSVILDTTYQIKLNISTPDTASVIATNNGPFCENIPEEVLLTAIGSKDSLVYEWRDPQGVLILPYSSSINLGEFEPSMTGIYTVSVDLGCGNVALDTTEVIQERKEICDPEEHIYLPNAFSPNGDGENEVLQLYGAGIVDVYLAIYDRWGQKVFVATSQNETWDGSFKGQALDSGVFGYFLRVKLVSEEIIEQQGNVTLVK